jgi:hypothetical protein
LLSLHVCRSCCPPLPAGWPMQRHHHWRARRVCATDCLSSAGASSRAPGVHRLDDNRLADCCFGIFSPPRSPTPPLIQLCTFPTARSALSKAREYRRIICKAVATYCLYTVHGALAKRWALENGQSGGEGGGVTDGRDQLRHCMAARAQLAAPWIPPPPLLMALSSTPPFMSGPFGSSHRR